MPDPQPLESLVSRYLDTEALGERSLWLRADIAVEARNLHHVTADEWAAQVGCSASWVRQMWRAADAGWVEVRMVKWVIGLFLLAAPLLLGVLFFQVCLQEQVVWKAVVLGSDGVIAVGVLVKYDLSRVLPALRHRGG